MARGDALLAAAVTRTVVPAFVRNTPARPNHDGAAGTLTPRELDTLILIATGLSNAEIAQRLVLSEATVKTHVGHLLIRHDVRDRVQAAIFVYEAGLVGTNARRGCSPP